MTSTIYSEHPKMFKNHPILFVILLGSCVFGVGFILLGVWYLKNKASKLTITNSEILYEEGLLSKSRSELSLNAVRTVNVKQTLANRMFGTGTVSIYTAGDSPEIVAAGFPNPHRIRDAIKSHQQNIAS
jgi:uncharacterized membrane protein YdbT with pleckstrin-like domain